LAVVRCAAAIVLIAAALSCERGASDVAAAAPATSKPGRALFFGRAGCTECHKLGDQGDKVRGPNLGVGDDQVRSLAWRARERRPDLTPIEYAVTSIVDPDADVAPGYARGVMRAPDTPPIALSDDDVIAIAAFLVDDPAAPLTDADLAAGRARIGKARDIRRRRVADAQLEAFLRTIPWSSGDGRRGHARYQALGCPLCHNNPNNPDVGAPELHSAGQRLGRDDLARWIVAPPKTRMPSYRDVVRALDVADLCQYLTAGDR
jgi:mono/diheme cytochrome c family protein